jgi:hypothetical protein
MHPRGSGLKISGGACIFNGDDPRDGIGGMAEKRAGGPDRQTRQSHGDRSGQPADRPGELSLRVS